MSDSSDDDYLSELSPIALAALQEHFNKLQQISMKDLGNFSNEPDIIEEDWQLSQFWYDDSTVQDLVRIVRNCIGIDKKIALISCPTLYKSMKSMLDDSGEVNLYEYDERFKTYGTDYIKYDYRYPLESIPENMKNYYDLVIADPPFLSDECLSKTTETIKYLTKGNIILCTGAVMEDLAGKLLSLKKSRKFVPKHKNNLGNDFACFSNIDIDNHY